MSDKYLCRGLNKETNKWHYGYYVKHLPYTPYPIGENNIEKDYVHYIIKDGFSDWGLPRKLDCFQVDLKTVCKCTGLRDVKNNLIFENDIVKINRKNIKDEDVYEKRIVVWDRYTFKLGKIKKFSRNNEIPNKLKHRQEFPLDLLVLGDIPKFKEFQSCEVIGNIFQNLDILDEN